MSSGNTRNSIVFSPPHSIRQAINDCHAGGFNDITLAESDRNTLTMNGDKPPGSNGAYSVLVHNEIIISKLDEDSVVCGAAKGFLAHCRFPPPPVYEDGPVDREPHRVRLIISAFECVADNIIATAKTFTIDNCGAHRTEPISLEAATAMRVLVLMVTPMEKVDFTKNTELEIFKLLKNASPPNVIEICEGLLQYSRLWKVVISEWDGQDIVEIVKKFVKSGSKVTYELFHTSIHAFTFNYARTVRIKVDAYKRAKLADIIGPVLKPLQVKFVLSLWVLGDTDNNNDFNVLFPAMAPFGPNVEELVLVNVDDNVDLLVTIMTNREVLKRNCPNLEKIQITIWIRGRVRHLDYLKEKEDHIQKLEWEKISQIGLVVLNPDDELENALSRTKIEIDNKLTVRYDVNTHKIRGLFSSPFRKLAEKLSGSG